MTQRPTGLCIGGTLGAIPELLGGKLLPDPTAASLDSTDRYAVAGNPVDHSLSPTIHACFAEQTGENLTYSKVLVPPGEFVATAEAFFQAGGRGLNVTVPCKGDAFDWVGEGRCNQPARLARAVNTIAREGQDYRGYNTDGIGLVRDLHENGVPLEGARVLLLGAGGAARGVIPSLVEAGIAALVIANRTADTARRLAQETGRAFSIDVQGAPLDAVGAGYDLIINGTSAGLSEQTLPLEEDIVRQAWCYDMMYGPKAVFFRWARQTTERGALDGLGMLIEQAAEAFYIWRGVRPDTRPVRHLLAERAA